MIGAAEQLLQLTRIAGALICWCCRRPSRRHGKLLTFLSRCDRAIRSLNDLIAVAHSQSTAYTNASWEHFWLNELHHRHPRPRVDVWRKVMTMNTL
jgi:hypothetical protein